MKIRNRRTITALVLGTTFLLALASVVSAQDWKGTAGVQLIVLDQETNKPIPDAKVSVYFQKPGNGPPSGTTNKKGKFSTLGMRSGGWTFLVEKDGYVPAEGVVPMVSNKRVTETVMLRPSQSSADREKADVVRGNIDQANTLMGQGKFAEARGLYLQVLPEVQEESRPPIKRAIALSYLQEKNFTEALRLIDEVLVALPEDVDTLRIKAQIQGQSGATDAAISTLDTLVASGDVDALKLIINLLLQAGREDEAQSYMAKLPEGETIDANALLNTGIDKYNADDIEGALSYFDRAAQENPDLADVYYYRGLAYLAGGESEKAKADFQKLIEIAPDHERAAEAKEFLAAL